MGCPCISGGTSGPNSWLGSCHGLDMWDPFGATVNSSTDDAQNICGWDNNCDENGVCNETVPDGCGYKWERETTPGWGWHLLPGNHASYPADCPYGSSSQSYPIPDPALLGEDGGISETGGLGLGVRPSKPVKPVRRDRGTATWHGKGRVSEEIESPQANQRGGPVGLPAVNKVENMNQQSEKQKIIDSILRKQRNAK